MTQKLKAPFTGRHIALIMITFLGTVVAVNVLMAVIASGSFGGTVVDNSYVASQQFNRWLKRAREQKAMGWSEQVGLDVERRIDLHLSRRAAGTDKALTGAAIRAVAIHPLGRAPEQAIGFTEVRPGHYIAAAPLPRGRWLVHFTIRSGAHEKHLIEELQ